MASEEKIAIQWFKDNYLEYPKNNITFSFMDFPGGTDIAAQLNLQISNYDPSNPGRYNSAVFSTYENMSNFSKNLVREIILEFEAVIGVSFTETQYSGNETFMFGVLQLPPPPGASGGIVAGATDSFSHPDPDYKSYVFMEKLLDDNLNSGNTEIYKHSIRHEILHALGLTHPDGTSFDSMKYTVMSYSQHQSFNDVYPTTLMLLDYHALHELGMLSEYDVTNIHAFNISRVLETVYDTGGNDTFDLSNQNRAAIIDLREGHFSSVGSSQQGGNGTAVENIGIAYGTVIENAIGSDEGDVIIGNVYDNTLKGGEGNDIIYGDGLSYDINEWDFSLDHKSAYAGQVGSGCYEGGGLLNESGNDLLSGGEGDDKLYGGDGNDSLGGEEGVDALDGGSGHDYMSGGTGGDVLMGGEGDDTLYSNTCLNAEDAATDTLLGGEGFDTYHAGNGDVIKDVGGKGRAFYNGIELTLGFHASDQADGEYTSIDGKFTYTLTGPDLLVSVIDSDPPVSFTIQNFSSGSLGIVLRDKPDTKIRTSIKVYEYWSIEEYRIQNPGARMAA